MTASAVNATDVSSIMESNSITQKSYEDIPQNVDVRNYTLEKSSLYPDDSIGDDNILDSTKTNNFKADNGNNDNVLSYNNGESDIQSIISSSDEKELLGGSFSDLDLIIDRTREGGVLNLEDDYSIGYNENAIPIYKNIIINGNGHTLNGKEIGRIFEIETNGISFVLVNITLKQGYSPDWGAAIFNNFSSTSITLIDCIVRYNEANGNFDGLGGGAIFTQGDLSIINSIISSNHIAHGYGGAIFCGGNLLVNNTTFNDNRINPEIFRPTFTANNLENEAIGINNGKKNGHCGGAVYCHGKCSIFNSDFHGNIAGENDNKTRSYGGAIYSDGDLFIYNTVFSDNEATVENGGAIYCEGNLYGDSLTFSFNHAYCGGAIYCEGETHINKSKFIENMHVENTTKKDFAWEWLPFLLKPLSYLTPSCGGAIYSVGKCYLDSCIFDGNSACEHGGAICADSDLTITGQNSFTNNHAERHFYFGLNLLKWGWVDKIGGAIYCKGTAKINNANFSANSAFVDGGAIYADGKCTVINCNFSNNSAGGLEARLPMGGAIRSKGSLTVDNCVFDRNKAEQSGGAIYADEKSFIYNSKFYNNHAYNNGGAVYTDEIIIKDSTFNGNSARGYGGAVYTDEIIIKDSTFNGNSARGYGGAVYTNTISQKVSNSKFNKNKVDANNGGAIYINNKCSPEFESCIFDENSAANNGGAIYLDSRFSYMKISSCTFTNNFAASGGAVYAHQVTPILKSVFLNNRAVSDYGNGGALYIANDDLVNYSNICEFTSCRFEGNTARNIGGAIYQNSMHANLKISYCTFVDNHADKKNYGGRFFYYSPGHSIYNTGYYKLIDMCWFGSNDPDFGGQLVEYHWGADDEDHKPSNYLKIYITLNETSEIYMGNTYKVTVYFKSTKGNSLEKDLLHSDGSFYGFGKKFSNAKVDMNDITTDVVFTQPNPTITGRLDYQSVVLRPKASEKNPSAVKITSCEDVTYPNALKVDYEITNMTEARYSILNSRGQIVSQGQLIDSKSTITVENLDVGKYSITIYNNKNKSTNPSNATAKFNVLKALASVNIAVDDVVYGTPSNIKINSNVDGKYTVNVNGTLFTIPVVNGAGNKAVVLDAGAYYANVSIDNKNCYGNANTTFNVLKADIDLFIDIFDEVYPHDVEGIVYASISGEFNLTMDNYQSVVVVKNNLAYINFGVLDTGTYEAVISFAGNENYNSASSKTTFNVNVTGTFFEIGINASEFSYGETATVTHVISDGATGTIKYYLNNVTLFDELPVSENLTLPILDAGNYIIAANYSGDINFKSSIDMLSFTVLPALNNVVLNVSDVTYGDDTCVEVSADVDGNYTVNINGTSIVVNVLNGKGSKSISLDAGRYYANVSFNNKNYNTKSSNATFNVFKADIDLIINVFDEVYPHDVECIIYASVDGVYNLTVAGCSTSVVVKYNFAFFNRHTLDAGTYDAVVSFAGDKNYNPVSNRTTFDVYASGTLFEIEINPDEIIYGETATVTHTLSEGATGNISYYLGNGTFLGMMSVDEDLKLPVLDANFHVIIAIYSGDGNFISANESAYLHVKPALNNVIVNVADVTYGENTTIEVSADVDGNYTVNINGTSIVVNVLNGKGSKSISLDAGRYYANVSFNNKNYNTKSSNATFNVFKADIDLIINVFDEVYPHDVECIIYASVDGVYNLTVAGCSTSVVVKYNFAFFNRHTLDAGTYDAVVSFAGDKNYNPVSNRTTFDVYASGTLFEIEINPDEIIYGETATVTHTLSEGATGNISYYLGNGTFLGMLPVDEDLKLPVLDANFHVIIAIYSGDGEFMSACESAYLHVKPALNNVIVNVADVTYGENTTIEVSADVDGNYTVNINGTSIVVNVLNGKGSKSISLDAGRYYANVSFNNKNYNTKSSNATFNVFKAGIDLIINVFDEVYPHDVECIIYASVDGVYNLTVAGCSTSVVVKYNFAFFNRHTLDAGTYDAVVSFAGDKNYNPVSNRTTFDVYASGTLFEIEINPDEIIYGETATVTHTLSEGATGNISYYLGNGTFLGMLPVDEDLKLPVLDAKFHVIIAIYSGDGEFMSACESAYLNVKPVLNNVIVNVADVTYGENTTIEVSADVDGIYQLDVNGTIYNITINNGFGSKIISLDAGTYYANASFADNNYNTVSKNADFNVYKAVNNLDMVIFDTVYLDDVRGFVYADADGEYNLTVGEYSTIVVVKNGKGEFNAGILDAGEYLAVVNYPGDLNYIANSYSTNVTVSKFVPDISLNVYDFYYGDVGVITITCDIPGSVNVTVNGITEILDLNGQSKDLLLASIGNVLKGEYQATLRLNNMDAGLYKVTVVYNGDENIESVELSGEFNVNALNVSMDVDAGDINVGDDEIITVILSSDVNGTVTVVVDDMNYSSSVSGGKAVITIPGLSAGYKNADVYYSGDLNHNPLAGNVSFAVNKLKADMSVESNTPVSGETIHIVVYLPADATGTVTLVLEGKYYTVPVKDGKAVFDIPGLAAGKYNITAYYSGDDKYDPAQIDSIITVNDNSTNQENQSAPVDKLSSSSNKAVKATDNAAGNPILMLLLTLMAIGFTSIRRFKK